MPVWLLLIAWTALQTPAQTTLTPAMPARPEAVQPSDNTDSYVFGAGDQIAVAMFGEPTFGGMYTISPDGKISINLIGEIQAAGRTRQQLQDAINQAALKMLKNPQSTVNLLAPHSKHIYFDGEGIAPGVMDLVMPIHLLEALSTHGCCLEFAKKDKVQIRRNGELLLCDKGGKKTRYFSYPDMLNGKQSNPLLQDGDHIIVP
jgi:polysaccharide export outer membrane protein